MKKSMLALLLLFALILCTACGEKTPTQPPKDSLMMESNISSADGKVTKQVLNTVSSDYKIYYTYTKTESAQQLTDGTGGKSTKLTFAQMQTMLDKVAAYTAEADFPVAGPYETGRFQADDRWYVVADNAPEANEFFFVYSVSTQTIQPLTTAYSGDRTRGFLSLNNIDAYGNITDGSLQGKWCYFFIDA